MLAEELPSPAELWWPFAVLAALETARGGSTWTADPDQQLLSYDGPDGWFCLQQRYRSRLVLWAAPHDGAPLDDLAECPTWVLSDAVRRAYGHGIATLAWHAHDEWDGLPEELAQSTVALLDRLVDLPADVADLVPIALRGDVSAADLDRVLESDDDTAAGLAVLERVGGEDGHPQGTVRDLLAEEIRKQMLRTPDRERVLVQRPAVLVHWARVADPPPGFAFAVCADDDVLVPATANHRLPEQFEKALLNVLRELHRQDSAEQHGHWLFARVTFANSLVGLERRYDGWPPWFTDPGPSLPSLSHEMARRAPAFRPAWASLLP